MSDTISRYLTRFPNARPSTLIAIQKREEMTERLRQEIGLQKPSNKPWWKRVLSAALKGRIG